MDLYNIESEYLDYLRRYDKKIPLQHSQLVNRPFVGIILIVNNINYFAPLSSPKEKHKTMKPNIDFLKISNGEYGVINLNNMLPAPINVCTAIKIKELKETEDLTLIKYANLIANQKNWCTRNRDLINNRAQKLYDKSLNNRLPLNIKERCVDFKVVEKAMAEWCK